MTTTERVEAQTAPAADPKRRPWRPYWSTPQTRRQVLAQARTVRRAYVANERKLNCPPVKEAVRLLHRAVLAWQESARRQAEEGGFPNRERPSFAKLPPITGESFASQGQWSGSVLFYASRYAWDVRDGLPSRSSLQDLCRVAVVGWVNDGDQSPPSEGAVFKAARRLKHTLRECGSLDSEAARSAITALLECSAQGLRPATAQKAESLLALRLPGPASLGDHEAPPDRKAYARYLLIFARRYAAACLLGDGSRIQEAEAGLVRVASVGPQAREESQPQGG